MKFLDISTLQGIGLEKIIIQEAYQIQRIGGD